MQRYVYGKIYDSQGFTAVSQMPRFGHNGVLTEEQISASRRATARSRSPVNR